MAGMEADEGKFALGETCGRAGDAGACVTSDRMGGLTELDVVLLS
jgi:hypothetical protein